MPPAPIVLSQDELQKKLIEIALKNPAAVHRIGQTNRCERDGGLVHFVRLLWPFVEPSRDFVENWHINAICEHLEAVTSGQITRLLINVPPGFAKSLLVNVFFPAWEWGPKNLPSNRYLCASYSQDLTIRDNVRFRQIITSDDYVSRWGERVQPSKDQFSLVKVGDTKTGWKLATSVGGVGTGERGDRVICFPYETLITTSAGPIPIGRIVEERFPVLVAGWNGKKIQWQHIDEYERNENTDSLIGVQLDAGGFECTAEHPVFVFGTGWVAASDLRPGDLVAAEPGSVGVDALPRMRRRDQAQAEPETEVLQQGVPVQGGASSSASSQQSAMLRVWDDGVSTASASRENAGSTLLQSRVPRSSQPRPEQPGVPEWSGGVRLRVVRRKILAQGGGGATRGVLLAFMPSATFLDTTDDTSAPAATLVRRVWRAIQAGARQGTLLLQGVQGRRSQSPHERRGKRQICSWQRGSPISVGLVYDVPREHSVSGQPYLPGVRNDASRTRPGETARASHRLHQGQPVALEPHHALPVLPRQNARDASIAGDLVPCVVRHVERRHRSPAIVYNLRVVPLHNYFANGILVHNCDDPNSVKDVESDKVRDSTNQWFQEVVPTRLNSPTKSAIIVIQQRTHEEDVSGIILSRDLGYEHLMIPMRYDSTRRYVTCTGWTDPRGVDPDGKEVDADGALAWPEMYPERIVEQLERTLGPYASSGQFAQSPVPRGGAIFERDWWQPYDISPDKKIRFPNFEYVVASVDTAFTEKQESDFSAMTVWGVFRDTADSFVMPRHVDDPGELMRISKDERPKVMLIHGWQKRLNLHGPPEDRPLYISQEEWASPYWINERRKKWGLVEWVLHTAQTYRIDMLLIETQAAGHSLEQELRRLHDTGAWGIRLIQAKGDKVSRAIAVQHLFSNGLVYVPTYPEDGALPGWATIIVDQFASFPKTRYKDLVDSGTHALQHLRDVGVLVRREEHDQAFEESLRLPTKRKPLYEV